MRLASQPSVAIVGSGIVGLANAFWLNRLGCTVTILDASPEPLDASVRNFGMLWPFGLDDPTFSLASRSLVVWREVIETTGMWSSNEGSLHLAYTDIELAVLEEYHRSRGVRRSVKLLSKQETIRECPYVEERSLKGALLSNTEVLVNPRTACLRLIEWLKGQGAVFAPSAHVRSVSRGRVDVGGDSKAFDWVIICPGHKVATFLNAKGDDTGLIPCRLQMTSLDAGPLAERFPSIASTNICRHYPDFMELKSIAALRGEYQRLAPELDEYSLDFMLCRQQNGDLFIGVSHHISPSQSPFSKARIDELILAGCRNMLRSSIPLRVVERWAGTYTKRPGTPFVVKELDDRTTLLTGLGGWHDSRICSSGKCL